MADKLSEYQGLVGRLHTWREGVRTHWSEWREARRQQDPHRPGFPLNLLQKDNSQTPHDYSHIYRKKTRAELVRVSAAVMGIEFSYAAETAFVSPQLLKIGVEHRLMTMVWGLSPLVGFFVTPVLGSLSDRCRLRAGRRRPFIALLGIGVLLGLLLVPNGEDLGYAMGDERPYDNSTTSPAPPHSSSHPWGVFFTIVGTVLLDFDADACQSPARAYLLDVTIPEDHARGLSTFTVMAGLGGFLGYALGGINWDVTALGMLLGGHVRAVFTVITVIFVICVSLTITSFREIPLDELERDQVATAQGERTKIVAEHDKGYGALDGEAAVTPVQQQIELVESRGMPVSVQRCAENGYINYGCDTSNQQSPVAETTFIKPDQVPSVVPADTGHPTATLSQYLLSIMYMPKSMRILCLTNLFCWMAHVCYSLYFTDFVGEAVFGGNPKADSDSRTKELYEEGVRFGCWGMAMYSLSCACYSVIIERLIKKFGARKVYVGGLLFYSVGMLLMALTKHRVGVILFSWTAGVMYSTLFTMPYLLVAHYHSSGTFEVTSSGEAKMGTQLRGLGTDVAIVSSMVFLAQFILSVCMGSIVSAAGTTTAVVSVASFLSLCGAITATQVMYLEL
ncbi:membrane-associated transporter protein [Anabrus simplex]|uniref:membrane-associated transporter protein n=1 Tax=Anabrus simplex TaxID=316456 RepID=UPI0035A364A3